MSLIPQIYIPIEESRDLYSMTVVTVLVHLVQQVNAAKLTSTSFININKNSFTFASGIVVVVYLV